MRKSSTGSSPNELDHWDFPSGCMNEGLEGIAQDIGVSFTPISVNPPPSVVTSQYTLQDKLQCHLSVHT
jgi:hypothetical protein